MNEIRTLLSLECRSFFGINKALHTRDKKAKKGYLVLCVTAIILILMLFCYVGGLAYGLCVLGAADIVPVYISVIASVVIFFFGLFKAGAHIFGKRGYDILVSMPLRLRSIAISRVIALYIEDLLFTLAIMLPATVVYGIFQRPTPLFYIMGLACTLLIPVIPLVASVILGTLIFAISSRMKRKSTVQTLLTVLVVVGVMIIPLFVGDMSESLTLENISRIADMLGEALEGLYPPAAWLGDAMINYDFFALAQLAAVSLATAAIAIALLLLCFGSVISLVGSFEAKKDYKMGEQQRRGLLRALYIREAKRYFSSSIYVTNTIIGPILGAVMSVVLCFVGIDTVSSALPVDVAGLLPFAFAGVFCMMTTTSTSISMEGKEFWVVRSLPISTKALLDSKILLNLSIMLPFYLVSVVAMAIATSPNIIQLLYLVLIPASVAFFTVILGITVNLKFHSFDWEKEETVVKQSLPAALGGFSGFFLCLVLGGAMLVVPEAYGDIARGAVCALLWIGTAVLYELNNKKQLHTL